MINIFREFFYFSQAFPVKFDYSLFPALPGHSEIPLLSTFPTFFITSIPLKIFILRKSFEFSFV